MISKLKFNSESLIATNNLPILNFLVKKKKKQARQIHFQVQAVQVYKTHAQYKIQVDDYGKIWIMEIRYSTLLQLYQKLVKHYGLKFTFPQKLYLGNLDQSNLKKRAIGIQMFFDEIESNYQITNSDEVQQFLTKQQYFGIQIVDYSETEEFSLDS